MASRVFNDSKVMFAAAKAETSKSAAVKKAATSSSAARTEKTALPKVNALTKPHPVLPALHLFVGAPEVSRAEATKKIWEHIKLHNISPTNKKEIFTDDKLKTIFAGKEKVGMFEMAKLLSPHFLKAN